MREFIMTIDDNKGPEIIDDEIEIEMNENIKLNSEDPESKLLKKSHVVQKLKKSNRLKNMLKSKILHKNKTEENEKKIICSKDFKFNYEDWENLGLNKNLIKAISENNWPTPTTIQKKAIPLVLTGKDILGKSVTGSGKTGAFLLPIMQNISKTTQFTSYIKTLIVLPTRELALQCYEMFNALNIYTKLTCSLVIGRASLEKQEAELRRDPDFVIATPGRIVDISKNSRDVSFDDLDYLIFDEADKLLDMGFSSEIDEILKFSENENKQTLLFSATLDKGIEKMVRLTLNNPLRVEASSKVLVDSLRQEIIKLKNFDSPDIREATLVYLIENLLNNRRSIVFMRTKFHCHRLAIILKFLGKPAFELHGDLTQYQRIEAYENFKNKGGILLATDLASRGLDFKEVVFVINYSLPREISKYVHRVGRTARAGKKGSCITFVNEKELRNFKKMARQMREKVFSRNVDFEEVKKIRKNIRGMEDDIKNVFKRERFEKELQKAEMEATKAQNLLDYRETIYNKPKREWIVSKKERSILRRKVKKLKLE